MKEIKQNNTLTENNTSDYFTIVEEIRQIACPNECSGNGKCNKGCIWWFITLCNHWFDQQIWNDEIVLGVCICRDGYGASDCSYDLSVPPDVFSIDIGSGDICEKSNCNEVFVDGDGFLNTETLTCRLQQFFVSRHIFHLSDFDLPVKIQEVATMWLWRFKKKRTKL